MLNKQDIELLVRTLENCLTPAPTTVIGSTPTPTPTPTPNVSTTQCLDQTQSNSVQIKSNATLGGNVYTFNNVLYDSNKFIGVTSGTYTLTGVPSSHPIGFVISDTSVFEVTQGTVFNTNIVEGINYDILVTYYTGDITFRVKGNFNTISYNCYYHGYMGGQMRLKYSNTCPLVSTPTPTITKTTGTISTPTNANLLPTQTPTVSSTTTPTSIIINVPSEGIWSPPLIENDYKIISSDTVRLTIWLPKGPDGLPFDNLVIESAKDTNTPIPPSNDAWTKIFNGKTKYTQYTDANRQQYFEAIVNVKARDISNIRCYIVDNFGSTSRRSNIILAGVRSPDPPAISPTRRNISVTPTPISNGSPGSPGGGGGGGGSSNIAMKLRWTNKENIFGGGLSNHLETRYFEVKYYAVNTPEEAGDFIIGTPNTESTGLESYNYASTIIKTDLRFVYTYTRPPFILFSREQAYTIAYKSQFDISKSLYTRSFVDYYEAEDRYFEIKYNVSTDGKVIVCFTVNKHFCMADQKYYTLLFISKDSGNTWSVIKQDLSFANTLKDSTTYADNSNVQLSETGSVILISGYISTDYGNTFLAIAGGPNAIRFKLSNSESAAYVYILSSDGTSVIYTHSNATEGNSGITIVGDDLVPNGGLGLSSSRIPRVFNRYDVKNRTYKAIPLDTAIFILEGYSTIFGESYKSYGFLGDITCSRNQKIIVAKVYHYSGRHPTAYGGAAKWVESSTQSVMSTDYGVTWKVLRAVNGISGERNSGTNNRIFHIPENKEIVFNYAMETGDSKDYDYLCSPNGAIWSANKAKGIGIYKSYIYNYICYSNDYGASWNVVLYIRINYPNDQFMDMDTGSSGSTINFVNNYRNILHKTVKASYSIGRQPVKIYRWYSLAEYLINGEIPVAPPLPPAQTPTRTPTSKPAPPVPTATRRPILPPPPPTPTPSIKASLISNDYTELNQLVGLPEVKGISSALITPIRILETSVEIKFTPSFIMSSHQSNGGLNYFEGVKSICYRYIVEYSLDNGKTWIAAHSTSAGTMNAVKDYALYNLKSGVFDFKRGSGPDPAEWSEAYFLETISGLPKGSTILVRIVAFSGEGTTPSTPTPKTAPGYVGSYPYNPKNRTSHRSYIMDWGKDGRGWIQTVYYKGKITSYSQSITLLGAATAPIPVTIKPIAVYAGNSNSSAILFSNNDAYSFGASVINGSPNFKSPTKIKDIKFKKIVLNNSVNAGIDTSGRLYIWGPDNAHGELLSPDTSLSYYEPVLAYMGFFVPKTSNSWSDVAIGKKVIYALHTNGYVWSWGSNEYGEQGLTASTSVSYIPKVLSIISNNKIAAGYGFVLILRNGQLYGCGDNSYSQLGTTKIIKNSIGAEGLRVYTSNNTIDKFSLLSDLGTGFIDIFCGARASYGIKSDSSLWSWGSNDYGVLGVGDLPYVNSMTYSSTPKMVVPAVKSFSAGVQHCLMLDTYGGIWSWGDNSRGQLGNNTKILWSNLPIKIGEGFAGISAGGYHSLAYKNDGSVWAWGWNYSSQLGNNSIIDSNKPIKIL